jgi:DNA-binding LacI/PurR family transcriptional regulator
VEPSQEGEALREAFGKLGAPAGVVQGCAAGIDAAAAALQRLLARRGSCRAFLCSSDETAVGVMRGLREAGLDPGRDCSVIGYGNTSAARVLGLTSIDPGFARMAELVMTPVAEAMTRGELPVEVFLVPPELRIRESCAPAAPP